jgi:hypothetical protein
MSEMSMMSQVSISTQKPAQRRARTRVLRLLAMALGLTAGAVGVAPPAWAGSLATAPVDGTYMIKVSNSGKCLAPRQASPNDSVPIQQFPCDSQNTSQRFTLQTVGTTSATVGGVSVSIPVFKITTFAGKCWTMPLKTYPNGSSTYYLSQNNIVQQTCSASGNASNQVFMWNAWQHPWEGMMIRATRDTTSYEYWNDLCLTIQNASSNDGAGAFLYVCNGPGAGAKNDTFIFMPI